MPHTLNPAWPVLKEYGQDHLLRVAMPLGGIGTGAVSLGGRGDLQDWEIVNRPAKGFTPKNAFFALYVRLPGGPPVTRALEGPLHPSQYEGPQGCPVPNHGLPRFQDCRFSAAYPFAQVCLGDPAVPLDVRLEAFNPLIPGDADDSGLPLAVLRYVLANKTGETLTAAVCGSLQNFIGADGSDPKLDWVGHFSYDHHFKQNFNEFRLGQEVQGLYLASAGLDPACEQFGTLALTTTASGGVTYRTAWADLTWGDSLLDFWDDFSADGELQERPPGSVQAPTASLAVKVDLPPHASRAITFLLTWRFPNRRTWTPRESTEPACDCAGDCAEAGTIGNYYAGQFADAWDVAEQAVPRLAELEARSLDFVRSLLASDLPPVVAEAALFNLSTLRTQTCFRTADGRFFGWEGCNTRSGCCHGSCTHVWNYEQATAFLFGELACSMRTVEFLYATDERGCMSFRANLPLDRATGWGVAAADGQLGCLMKLYRDWQLSGDDGLLRALWPQARRALEFCWIPNGWDADQDGVMEGCQHNTMDVEYYGPNPQMGTWYLGALRAMEEMARYLGEVDFADTCRSLFTRGSQWLDAHLFNGEYYQHEIRPPGQAAAIAPGLRHDIGARDLVNPELQLGAGCLIDQLVGQYMAHVCGLGYLLDPAHIQATLDSLLKYNFQSSFTGHFNHMRSYVLAEEAGMLMAAYPRGQRPERPFPYFNEVMTGFEYTVAAHLIYAGRAEAGLDVIRAIRARYDGLKRNPFDEAECGHHYARAMASWAAVLALTGFQYSGVEQAIRFAARPGPATAFWSTGWAWGVCRQSPKAISIVDADSPDTSIVDADSPDAEIKVEIEVKGGRLPLRRVALSAAGAVDFSETRWIAQGESLVCLVPAGGS